MAEAMTTETIIEAYWQMQGFWTRLRFPIQTSYGAWTDIDLVGYKPEGKWLVIAESKVRGPKRDVYAFTKYSLNKYGNILEYDKENGRHNYFAFLRNVPIIIKDRGIFINFKSMVKNLTIQLVSNYYIAEDVKEDAERSVYRHIANKIPKGIKAEIKLQTTLDLILEIIIKERESLQGRRYGNPIIDIAREINRYLFPNIKFAGRDAQATELIIKKFKKKFYEALGINNS